MVVCEFCKDEHDGTFATGRFCSRSCSNKYARQKDRGGTKKVKCCSCQKEIKVNKRSPANRCKCDKCKTATKKIKKYCLQCGEIKCLKPSICKKNKTFPLLINFLGFNKSTIGTIKIYEEWERIKNKIEEDYWENKLSSLDISTKYNYPYGLDILRHFKIKRRTLSEATKNAIQKGKSNPCKIPTTGKIKNSRFKHGWHTTWNDKKVFYRSSYELDYARELDEQKIDYEMEALRILYWDSQLLKQRIAIPDFYLLESNTIVEVKSNWTYDEQRMVDRVKEYKRHGYKFKLILEHKEKYSKE